MRATVEDFYEDDDPFRPQPQVPPIQTQPNPDRRPSSPSSVIDIDVSPTTSDPDESSHTRSKAPSNKRTFTPHTHASPSRRPSSPRSGPHSKPPPAESSADGPAGNKKNKGAQDLWAFYDQTAAKRECPFCKYVSNHFNPYFLFMNMPHP